MTANVKFVFQVYEHFLKYNSHSQTQEYIDMLYTKNLLPIITKPTMITNQPYLYFNRPHLHKYLYTKHNFWDY